MKAFLEEYGVVLVSSNFIMIIVVLATPLGQNISKGIESTVNKLVEKMGEGLNVTYNGTLK